MRLIDFKRYVNQRNKIPVGKWNDEANWMNYNMALANAKRNNCGISIVLGKINDEYTLAGIDIDTIRDKLSGKIDTNIEEDIAMNAPVYCSLLNRDCREMLIFS